MQNIFVEGCLLTASLVAQAVDASLGDRSTVFTKCLSECATNNGCSLNTARIEWIFEPCFSCKYDCTWRTVSYFTEVLNEEIPQFYGKWPFIAVRLPLLSFIPVQELASVVFSIMNLHSSLKMYRAVRLLPARARMKIVWYNYSLIGIFIICIMTYSIYLLNNLLSFQVHFDYGYNMRCCIAFSLATAFIYTIWMAIEWHTRTRWQRRSIPFLAVVVFGGLASILLEVFDFVPLFWLVDAHALFHLATVPLPLYLITFIELETEYEMNLPAVATKIA
ncbi:unnamed protein product [Toxocara canis]|uniref:Post-GPI attachment to proteins factor 3 n=1 Tax=Toxocara canis TaxID=6265 RepID=A0A183UH69_TOXCA|nr:unnamed protein product [Toxocara canis]